MELPLGIGSADILFVTPEGNLVLAEVKLWGNPKPGARSSPKPWNTRPRSSSSTTQDWKPP